MKSKYSVQERLLLIEKILAGIPTSKVAENVGISETLLRKWIKRYKEEGKDGLKAKTPGRPKIPRASKKLGPPKPLVSHERLRMVQEVLEGKEKVSEIAKKYGVSRVTLYKWLKRYRQAPEKKLKAVVNKQ